MRTILLGDIIAGARALLAVPDASRAGVMDMWVCQADAAHRFHKRLSKPHPLWGNGSLMARANMEMQVEEPYMSDIAYLRAMQIVIKAIVADKSNADRETARQVSRGVATHGKSVYDTIVLPRPEPFSCIAFHL